MTIGDHLALIPAITLSGFSRLLTTILGSVGYQQGQSRDTLFFTKQRWKKIILIVYIDDIILRGEKLEEIERLKRKLTTEFEIKDLGQI